MKTFDLDTRNGLHWPRWCKIGNAAREMSPGLWQVVIQKPTRTEKQNNALWLFCDQISKELNGAGVPVSVVSVLNGRQVNYDWDKDLVKKLIWNPVQKAHTGKESSRNLKVNELDKVAIPIIDLLTSEYQFGLMFPSQLSYQLERDAQNL